MQQSQMGKRFSVTFDVLGATGSSSEVSFTDDPTLRKLASFRGARSQDVQRHYFHRPAGYVSNSHDGSSNTLWEMLR